MSWMDKVYKLFPVSIQNFLFSSYGVYWKWLRFGGNFRKYVAEYRQREYFTNQEWKSFQEEQLNTLITLAYKHVPFYRSCWSKGRFQEALNGNLAALPLLEKEPLRKQPLSFIRDDLHPLHPKHFATSGSTGTPIETYWTVSEVRNSLALREARSANWAGVSFQEPRATFSGRMIEPNPNSAGPFYRFNAAEKQVYLSAFHLRADTAKDYVRALREHHVVWMTGYAVSFYLLAKHILDQNLKVPSLKAVITTSEKLTSEMRQVMEEAYQCCVYEEYSTVENALFASECECGRLHVSPDVAIVEILREDGTACVPGEIGEVVTTCLMRTYQPLIRYRLGDLAAWDDEPCPCGRQMPIIKDVLGRIEDVIIGPDGRQMVRFHGIFVEQPHVQEGQIIQEALDFIRVKVVPTDGFNNEDVQDIIQRVRQRLGESVHVEVELVHEIPRTKAGKFKAVISNLKQEN